MIRSKRFKVALFGIKILDIASEYFDEKIKQEAREKERKKKYKADHSIDSVALVDRDTGKRL